MKATSGSPPVLIALAGPNGAGKTTFYRAHLQAAGVRYVNADVLAGELSLEPYAAAQVANALRRELVRQGQSFVFETVFSDPVGEKLEFLKDTARQGYEVTLCFIGISSAEVSAQRVSMRVSQGGHDVPTEKLEQRYPRTLTNLRRAVRELPHVLIFDNEVLGHPFQKVAEAKEGRVVWKAAPLPQWMGVIAD